MLQWRREGASDEPADLDDELRAEERLADAEDARDAAAAAQEASAHAAAASEAVPLSSVGGLEGIVDAAVAAALTGVQRRFDARHAAFVSHGGDVFSVGFSEKRG